MNYIVKCHHCQVQLRISASAQERKIRCPRCGEVFIVNRDEIESAREEGKLSFFQRIVYFFARLVGVEKLKAFSFSVTFAGAKQKHTQEDIEERLSEGTRKTTPSLAEINTAWPRPWLFYRVVKWCLLIFLLLVATYAVTGNRKNIPAILFFGNIAIPFATLIFIYEMNVWRNVSFYVILRLMFGGCVLSFLFSDIIGNILLFLFGGQLNFLKMSVAGIIEEPAKLLALMFIFNKMRYRHKLNGLLFGAAIGAGFGAFESAGYAFDCLFNENGQFVGNITNSLITTLIRGLLAPAMHVAWSAITACALWRVMGEKKFSVAMFLQWRFLRLFLLPVLLHMYWNSEYTFIISFAICCLISWGVVFSLVQEGLHEVRDAQARLNAP